MLVPIILALIFVVSIFQSVHAQSNKEVSIVSDALKLADKAFDPNPVMINQGETVTWTNKDFGIHTITENQELFSSKDLRPVQTFEHIFAQAGTFDYHCKIHPTKTRKTIVN
ncbi:MAG: cupredoxin domain-containing protein [Candidatus Nitrosocosmicus sp.]|nr:cupredoxin domain-containing protein [Candidatus Nitrosocosmicus sp.]MDN5868620.1 cupredoxin domain-containing protein [Candidatus Nitrosocosmicus sp.]